MVIKENHDVDIEQDLKDTYGDFRNFLRSFGMLYSDVLSNEPGTFSLDKTGWSKLSKLMDDVNTVSKKLHTIERNLTLRKDWLITFRRLNERMETGFDGYAVNYRDIDTAHHHLAKYRSFDEAMNAYEELDALSDRYMEGDIDVADYHIAVDDIITDAIDNEYEINFRQIGRDGVWESPYGGVYKVVNPVAVDLYF